jgi:hypothetical protein
MTEREGKLEIREEAGGLRHYLGDEPIHAGDILELLLPDGIWLEGRYEWDFRRGGQPLFFVALGSDWEGKARSLTAADRDASARSSNTPLAPPLI